MFATEHVSHIPTRVFIFESTQMASELLSSALEKSHYGIHVVGTATAAEATDLTSAAESDVALISARLRDGPRAGLTVLQRLALRPVAVRCVMLLDRAEEDIVIEAFASGALGVCDRSQPYELLCKCVRWVHQGQVWVNSQQLRDVLAALVESTAGRRFSAQKGEAVLSSREMAIVSLVGKGLKNHEIAHKLAISNHTVKNHLFHIFKKMNISTRAGLVLYLAGRSQEEQSSKT